MHLSPLLRIPARFALLLSTFAVLPTATSQTLVSGSSVAGVISVPGEVDTWFFDVAAGDTVMIRAAAGFWPRLRVFSPTGQQLHQSDSSEVVEYGASNAVGGLYSLTLQKQGTSVTTTGPYEIHFARLPGVNELGRLPSGGSVTSNLDVGDLDTFTFDLAAGDSYWLRLAELPGSTTRPRLIVYDPTGASVGDRASNEVVSQRGTATLAGTYTALVLDARISSSGPDGAGPFELQFLRFPGPTEFAFRGAAGEVLGDLTIGDLDSFTLSLAVGESYLVQLAELPGGSLQPALTIYGPDGISIGGNSRSVVATVGGRASLAGDHTVVVSDARSGSSGEDGTGPYVVRWITAPGANENGVLTDGASVSDDISIGDLDSWSFVAAAGTPILITAAEVGVQSLAPRVAVYGPDGAFLGADFDGSIAAMSFSTIASGIHTVLVSDSRTGFSPGANGTGNYMLTLTGAVMTPSLTQNQRLPAALPSDPTLSDNGGDPLSGPRVGDGSEPINFELNCNLPAGTGFYLFLINSAASPGPIPTLFGALHVAGSIMIQTGGLASGGPETMFRSPIGLPLANDTALVGFTFAAQGFCIDLAGVGRLSNGFVQVIGL